MKDNYTNVFKNLAQVAPQLLDVIKEQTDYYFGKSFRKKNLMIATNDKKYFEYYNNV